MKVPKTRAQGLTSTPWSTISSRLTHPDTSHVVQISCVRASVQPEVHEANRVHLAAELTSLHLALFFVKYIYIHIYVLYVFVALLYMLLYIYSCTLFSYSILHMYVYGCDR